MVWILFDGRKELRNEKNWSRNLRQECAYTQSNRAKKRGTTFGIISIDNFILLYATTVWCLCRLCACQLKLTLHRIDCQWLISEKIALEWFDSGSMHSIQMKKNHSLFQTIYFYLLLPQHAIYTYSKVNVNDFNRTNLLSFLTTNQLRL